MTSAAESTPNQKELPPFCKFSLACIYSMFLKHEEGCLGLGFAYTMKP